MTGGIDEPDEKTVDRVRQMLSITNAYGHLLPSITTEKDVEKIFGKHDPLELTTSEKASRQKS